MNTGIGGGGAGGRLQGKVAIVTGGGGGIGSAVVRRFVAEAWRGFRGIGFVPGA